MKGFLIIISVTLSFIFWFFLSAIISVITGSDLIGFIVSAALVIIVYRLLYKKINKNKPITTVNNNSNPHINDTVSTDEVLNEREFYISRTQQQPPTTRSYIYKKANYIPNEYVVFDFETTGLDAQSDKIIQIGAIKYRNHVEVDRFISLVNPKVNIPPKITQITGISNSDIKNAPTINVILPRFYEFIDDSVLIAHNASFDMKFLINNLNNCNLKYKNNLVIDTLSLARKYIKDVENHKLETLKKYLHLNVKSHDALADCISCATLFQKCIELRNDRLKLEENEIQCLEIVTRILEENNRDITKIKYSRVSNYFDISAFMTIARFKLNGRKTYILTQKSLEDVKLMFPTAICEVAAKGETGNTRIYFTDIQEIIEYKNLYVSSFDEAIKNQQQYVSNVQKGARVLEEYYSL